jgi:glycosyltransferase involved in cell wall biosynthesis
MNDKRLKVAHIITLLELGGAQQNTLYTVQHLDRAKFEPVLLCGRGAILDEETSRLDCRVRFLRTLVRPVNPLLDFLAFFELFLVLRQERPYIVHTHSSKAGILGRWAARWAGVPVIVHTFHGFGFTPTQKKWIRRLYVFLERNAARVSRVLIAVSKSNLEEAVGLGIGRRDQFRLIRSGVPLRLYTAIGHRLNSPAEDLTLSPEQKLVVTIGPFKPQKNLLDFVRAAAKIHAEYASARFLIVGDGALRGEIEAEIRRHGLEKVFFLPGWRRDIPNIFMRADVFVMTSLWEGLPRALVEAMAAGLPCVANAVDGVKDVLTDGQTGYLVPPHRPDITADRVLHLLRRPDEAMRMGQTARQSIGIEFDIDEMVRRQEELYDELAAAAAG